MSSRARTNSGKNPRPSSSSTSAAIRAGKKEQVVRRKEKKSVDDDNHDDVKSTESTNLTESIFASDFISELQAQPIPERLSKIAERVGLTAWNEDLRENILVSFHSGNHLFCLDNAFTPEKTACLMNIMKFILEQAQELNATQELMCLLVKRLILKCTRYKPGSASNEGMNSNIQVFAPADVKPISDYIRTAFLNQYRLYTYVFANEQAVEEEPPMTLSMIDLTERVELAVNMAQQEFTIAMEDKEKALKNRLAELERLASSAP